MPQANSSTGTRYQPIVIVGAGLAGLQAANNLITKFPDLLLVEASSRLGGRIQQVSCSIAVFVDYKLLLAHCNSSTDLQEALRYSAINFIFCDCHQIEGIAPWPVQLGPEFIHGAKSSLKVRAYP